MSKPRLLVIEDDAALAAQYRWAFTDCKVLLAADRAQALAIAKREQPDAALLDLGLPPDAEGVEEGFATLAGLRVACPGLPVIVASGQGQRENQLRAVAEGAYDFCEKPVDLAVLRTIIDRALRLRQLEEENRRLAQSTRSSPIRDIITADDAMLKVCRTIERLSQVSVPVLLLGESGTGKEALARALHDMGPRAKAQFIAINCAAIPEPLLESELFGHERGAFTGATRQVIGRIETAQGGTLFLDEIGDLPAGLQAKMLRFLQDGVIERVGGRTPIRVDARLVSATNQPLEKQAESGAFRADLLYRLNTLTVRIPPLRERGEDRLLLARYFLARHAQEFGSKVRGLDASAVGAIMAHPFPGNVRELGNRIRRAVLMAEGHSLTPGDLELTDGMEMEAAPEMELRTIRLKAERGAIEQALARSNGGLAQAARLLGVSRPTIYDLLATHGIETGRRQDEPPPTSG